MKNEGREVNIVKGGCGVKKRRRSGQPSSDRRKQTIFTPSPGERLIYTRDNSSPYAGPPSLTRSKGALAVPPQISLSSTAPRGQGGSEVRLINHPGALRRGGFACLRSSRLSSRGALLAWVFVVLLLSSSHGRFSRHLLRRYVSSVHSLLPPGVGLGRGPRLPPPPPPESCGPWFFVLMSLSFVAFG